MNMKPSKLIPIVLCLLAGCEAKVQTKSSPPKEPSKLSGAFHHYALTDTNKWLPLFEIWKCDDGTFEVKTVSGTKGKFGSLQEAEEFRYERALGDAALFATPDIRGRDCGVRVK